MNPSKEMRDWFVKRTNHHIQLVRKYCHLYMDYDTKRFIGLMYRTKDHDQSKFKDPEVIPYIYITWQYKCKDDGIKFEPPKDIEDLMNKATYHHVVSNRHHPEFYSDRQTVLINRKDRDKPPEKIIDATSMPVIDIAEMVADWAAMSEEKNSSLKSWMDKNIGIRWKFSPDQINLINELAKISKG